MTKFRTNINDRDVTIDGQWYGDQNDGVFNVETIEIEGYQLKDNEIVNFLEKHDDRVRDEAESQIEVDNVTMFNNFQEGI